MVASCCKIEKAGIPCAHLLFEDMVVLAQQTALREGVPNLRLVVAPRTGTGEELWGFYKDNLIKALTDPLTDKEKESGLYTPPPMPRVCFEGTYDDAQEFYPKPVSIDLCGKCPITTWTDGFPIIIPTEEKVKEMLTGTSHKPDEMIKRYTYDKTTGKYTQSTSVVSFSPMKWNATVELVAVNAVMSGCKPEYLPIVLAISTSGCGTGSTHFQNYWQIVSGPIAKEIGMNAGVGVFSNQNVANNTIGRAYQMMATNLSGSVIGANKMNTQGAISQRAGICFAENSDGLPVGWLGFNEECGVPKNHSVIENGNFSKIGGDETSPGGFRTLQSGTLYNWGIGLRIETLTGKVAYGDPNPKNSLPYFIPDIWAMGGGEWGSTVFFLTPEMASAIQASGFPTKQSIYEWIYSQSFVTYRQFREFGWTGFRCNYGEDIEQISGKKFKDLPDDYMIPINAPYKGDTPFSCNMIFVTGGDDTQLVYMCGPKRSWYSIEPWR